jgi:uncharacterized protein YqjF (DUF2071 family)
MNADRPAATPSELARARMLSVRYEPLFYATWDEAVMIHYEVDRAALQRSVPFPLDLHDGRAFVSLVAFTLRRMRPKRGGRLAEWLLKPIATHEFLNVRSYVRVNGEPGIFFLAEWLSNAISVPLGPPVFGLPYRYGRIRYDHEQPRQLLTGRVEAKRGALEYHARIASDDLHVCEPGSMSEFLMERYTAFTRRFFGARMFRVWHEPWPQTALDLTVTDDSLLAATGEWWRTAQPVGANYSPGVDVWMGRPLRLRE